MSDIPSFPYASLWEERTLRSVANLTRRDAEEFLALAPRVPIKTQVTAYPLEDAGGALGRPARRALHGGRGVDAVDPLWATHRLQRLPPDRLAILTPR